MSELQVTSNFTPDQLKLITDTVAKGATKDELQLFLYRCKAMDLDPLKPGQIYFVKYGTSPGTIVVGIDGFRAKAVRTGKLAGIKRGVLKDDKGKITGGWAEVYRSDWKDCAREEVELSEYTTGRNMWAKMPATMIKKVAEVAALRMAFPDDLGGLYSGEEMEQAAPVIGNALIVPEQPGEGNGVTGLDPDVIPFGKDAMKRFDQVGKERLIEIMDKMPEWYAKRNKPLPKEYAQFCLNATHWIVGQENAPLDKDTTDFTSSDEHR